MENPKILIVEQRKQLLRSWFTLQDWFFLQRPICWQTKQLRTLTDMQRRTEVRDGYGKLKIVLCTLRFKDVWKALHDKLPSNSMTPKQQSLRHGSRLITVAAPGITSRLCREPIRVRGLNVWTRLNLRNCSGHIQTAEQYQTVRNISKELSVTQVNSWKRSKHVLHSDSNVLKDWTPS